MHVCVCFPNLECTWSVYVFLFSAAMHIFSGRLIQRPLEKLLWSTPLRKLRKHRTIWVLLALLASKLNELVWKISVTIDSRVIYIV